MTAGRVAGEGRGQGTDEQAGAAESSAEGAMMVNESAALDAVSIPGRYVVQVLLDRIRLRAGRRPSGVWRSAVRHGRRPDEMQTTTVRLDRAWHGSDGAAHVGRTIFLGMLPARARLEVRLAEAGGKRPQRSRELAHRFTRRPSEWAGAHEIRAAGNLARIRVLVLDLAQVGTFVTEDGEPKGRLRRFEWLVEVAGTESGHVAPDWWLRAMQARRRMRPAIAARFDPGATGIGARKHRLDGAPAARVSVAEDPLPGLTPGAVGRFVRVSSRGPLDGAVLSIGLSPEETEYVDPASLRVFRYDEKRGRMSLVHLSGLGEDGSYVYAAIDRPGTYGVYGLPRARASRLVLGLTRWLYEAAPLLSAVGLKSDPLIGGICREILCAPGGELLDDPAALAAIGLADITLNTTLLHGARLVQQPASESHPRDGSNAVAWQPIGTRGAEPIEPGTPGAPGPLGPPGGGPGLPDGPRRPPGERMPRDICQECLDRPLPDFDRPERLLDVPDFQLLDIISEHGLPGPDPPRWYSIGPRNIGGRIKDLAFVPDSNGREVWAAAAQGGLWKSLDGGRSWHPRTDFAATLSHGSIAVFPGDTDIVYAGTGEYPRRSATTGYAGMGVLRSQNGWTFELMSPAPSNIDCSRIVVHPTDSDIVYVAGTRGIERWDAAAGVWVPILTDDTSDIALDPADPKRLFAAVESLDGQGSGGIAVTDNAEAASPTWRLRNAGLTVPSRLRNFAKIAFAPSDPDIVYVSINRETQTEDEDGNVSRVFDGAGVYRWDSNRRRWIDKGKQVNNTQGTWCNSIAVHPEDPDHVIVAGVGWGNRRLRFSHDGGDTWRERSHGHADNHAIVFNPAEPAVTLVANDGGVWRHRSEAGTEQDAYESSNDSLVTTQFFNIGVSRKGPLAVGGSTQDQGIPKRDGFGDYIKLGGNEGGIFEIDPSDSRRIFWDPWNGDLRVTETGFGADKRAADNGIEETKPGRTVSPKALAIHPDEPNILICATTARGPSKKPRVYRSTDGAAEPPGTGWTLVVDDTGDVAGRIVFAPSDPSIVYFATFAGQVWRSVDTGASFQRVSDSTLPAAKIRGLAVDFADPDVVLVALAGGGSRERVWRSEDRGVSWASISGTRADTRLPDDIPFVGIAQDRQRPDRLYAACLYGVLVTPNGGADWQWMDEGLPNAPITDLGYVPSGLDGDLYVSTIGRGLWRRTTRPYTPGSFDPIDLPGPERPLLMLGEARG